MKVKVMGSNLCYLLKSSLLYKSVINSNCPAAPKVQTAQSQPQTIPNLNFCSMKIAHLLTLYTMTLDFFKKRRLQKKNFGKTHDDMIRTMNCSMKLVAFFATICRILGQKTMLKLEKVSRYSNNFRFRSYSKLVKLLRAQI